MRFIATANLDFSVPASTRFFFNLRARATDRQRVEREAFDLRLSDGSSPATYHPPGDERLVLLTAASDLTVNYEALIDCNHDSRPVAEVANWPAAPLDPDRAAYLFPSRYCESDQLGRLAWQKFGGLDSPYARASAITDWIHANTAYVLGSTHAGTSACAILVQRAGVCRDFAHLGIALCRALNLPARYATGYACGLQPPDMHAWMEVAIGDHWVAFDPTRRAPPRGLVRVAHGRDAADTAIVTSFGPASARAMTFDCRPADPNEPIPGNPDPGEERVLVCVASPASTP